MWIKKYELWEGGKFCSKYGNCGTFSEYCGSIVGVGVKRNTMKCKNY